MRTLLNHLILWTSYSLEARAQGESVGQDLMDRDFAADPGFAAGYRAQLDRALTAWADPATWERSLDVMGTPTPSADVAALNIAEMVLHGWDLAVATGQAYTVSEPAAAAAAAGRRGERRPVPPVQGVRRAGRGAADGVDARPRPRAVRPGPRLERRAPGL